jgi:hypothetical protein
VPHPTRHECPQAADYRARHVIDQAAGGTQKVSKVPHSALGYALSDVPPGYQAVPAAAKRRLKLSVGAANIVVHDAAPAAVAI